jgi:tryptophan-rich sensory protein
MVEMSSNKIIALQAGNAVSFIATLAVNVLAGTTFFGEKTTAQISDQYPTLITPAGYVFAIWGIIYTLLAIYVVYQALPSQRNKPYQTQISGLFILSSIFNIIWLVLWGYGCVTISVALIAALLASLAAIYIRLNKIALSRQAKICVHLPFDVYFGWVTVATAANVAIAFSALGWIKWTAVDAVWAIVFAVILTFVFVVIAGLKRNDAYGLVAIWAFVGIAMNQAAIPAVQNTAFIAAAIVAIAVIAAAAYTLVKHSG